MLAEVPGAFTVRVVEPDLIALLYGAASARGRIAECTCVLDGLYLVLESSVKAGHGLGQVAYGALFGCVSGQKTFIL